jgi:hypothetical protein
MSRIASPFTTGDIDAMQPRLWSTSTLLTSLALTVFTAGCEGQAQSNVRGGLEQLTEGGAALKTNITPSQVQSALMTQCDNVSMQVADATGKVLRRPDVRVEAQLFVRAKRLAITSAVLTIGSETNPLVGFIDLYALVVLQGQSFDGPAARDALDDTDRETMKASLAIARSELLTALRTTMSDEQIRSIDEMIEAWRVRHPEHDAVAYVRLTEFAVERQINPSAARQGELPKNLYGLLLLDPLAGLDPTVREIERARLAAERNLYWIKRLPAVLSWQVELTSSRILNEPQVTRVLESAETVAEQSKEFAGIGKSFAQSGEVASRAIASATSDLGVEGKRLLEQTDNILDARLAALNDRLFDRLASERSAALEQANELVEQRVNELTSEFFRDIETERSNAIRQATESIATERDAALQQAATLVAREREATLKGLSDVQQGMQGLIDRAAMLAVLVVIIAALAALAVGWRLGRRRT